jgi:hypothetical protein
MCNHTSHFALSLPGRAFREARGATMKARQICVRRRDGELARVFNAFLTIDRITTIFCVIVGAWVPLHTHALALVLSEGEDAGSH